MGPEQHRKRQAASLIAQIAAQTQPFHARQNHRKSQGLPPQEGLYWGKFIHSDSKNLPAFSLVFLVKSAQ